MFTLHTIFTVECATDGSVFSATAAQGAPCSFCEAPALVHADGDDVCRECMGDLEWTIQRVQ